MLVELSLRIDILHSLPHDGGFSRAGKKERGVGLNQDFYT